MRAGASKRAGGGVDTAEACYPSRRASHSAFCILHPSPLPTLPRFATPTIWPTTHLAVQPKSLLSGMGFLSLAGRQ